MLHSWCHSCFGASNVSYRARSWTNRYVTVVVPGRHCSAPGVAYRSAASDATCFFLCCFTSTETIKLISDGEPRTSTSTFTQHLSSDVQYCFTSTKNIEFIRDEGAQDVHLDFHQASDVIVMHTLTIALKSWPPTGEKEKNPRTRTD